ncbi:TPA: hypothetical protein L3830_004816 [Pseudomonas aeruginosa]|uniref:hypothetical protein n=1 Tax=Pseudomonas aeruginosa TaxID=287 RepID=UPI001266B8FB|nr:hypothetical protein [Pseudomonas aeruginosa]HBN9243710.1 hypothetical protein [Pseudomonas aeruginosa]
MLKKLLRQLLSKKQPAPTVLFGAAAPDQMTDAQLRDWALRLHAQSVDPAKLSGMGIDPAMLLTAQLDDQALADVRRWSGIPQPTRNV